MTSSLFGVGDILNANQNGTIVPQSFIGTAGQTTFVLTNFTYTPSTNSLEVYINGSLQRSGRDYVETSSTSFTLLQGVLTGDLVDSYGIPLTVATAFPATFAMYQSPVVGGPASNVGIKLGERISMKDAGAFGDGVNSDDAAWNLACAYLNSLPNGGVLYFPPTAGNYKFNLTKTWNANKILVDLGGNTVDVSAVVGYIFTMQQSSVDPNARQGLNRSHPMTNGKFIGGAGAALQTFIQLQDNNPIAGVGWLPGVSLCGIALENFYRCYEFGFGSFLFNARNCNHSITGGAGYDTIIYSTNAANSGENNSFTQCFFSISTGSLIRQLNPNGTFRFDDCSADYMLNFFDVQAGEVWWNGYIECNTDTDYWGKVSGVNSLLDIQGRISVTGNKAVKELFFSDPTCTNGGITGGVSLQFGAVTYGLANAIGGTGRTALHYKAHSNNTVHPGISAFQNIFANASFESAGLADWTTVSGGTPPAISTDIAHTGTHSLKFTGAVGSTPLIERASIACSPGEYFVGGFWYNTANIAGTGATFFSQTEYVNRDGSVVLFGQANITTLANTAGWVYVSTSTKAPAPPGTVSAVFNIDLFGTTSGTPLVYVDDVNGFVVKT